MNKADTRSKKGTQIAVETEKNGQNKVKSAMVTKENEQITAKIQEKKTPKKPDEPY